MKKKKSGGGGANWMDTYGDMVTLLLCFFVLLYSMSTISEENWKALVMSFNPDAIPVPTEHEGEDGPVDDDENQGGEMTVDQQISQEDIDDAMQKLYEALKEYSENEGKEDIISVTQGDGRVYVTFNGTTFFQGYSYTLQAESIAVLDTVCDALSSVDLYIDEVRIQGHTAQEDPNTPNSADTDRFLASNRATRVLVYLQEHSTVDPGRLVSEGLGQWHPVGDNATSEGRASNRRVELIISGRNLEQEAEGLLEYQTGTGQDDVTTNQIDTDTNQDDTGTNQDDTGTSTSS